MRFLLIFSTLLCSCVSQAHPPRGASEKLEAKVLTYNVLSSPRLKEYRLQPLLDLIGKSDADAIALQEVAPWFHKELTRQDWYSKYHSTLTTGSHFAPGGLLILSKAPITTVHSSSLPSSRQGRRCLIVETSLAGQPCTLANCHLESPLESSRIRALQLETYFSKLKGRQNILFLGDFNFGSHAQPETSHIPNTFIDCWEQTQANNKGYTWDIEQSPMAARGSYPGEPSRRLDRIFLNSHQFKPLKSQIIGNSPTKAAVTVYPSDHFGLITWLSLK